MEPIVLIPPTPLISSLGEALDIDLPSPVTVFPLRAKDNSLGVFRIVVEESKVIDRSLMNEIQEFTDIAVLCLERYQTNEPQGRQLRELQHEDALRRPFISMVTHEFRTPLASLKTCFALFQESDEIQIWPTRILG